MRWEEGFVLPDVLRLRELIITYISWNLGVMIVLAML